MAWTEEGKKRQSERMKGENNPFFGKHHSEKTKKKIAKTEKGKILSEETRKKITIALSGENNPNFGKPRPEETKKKIAKTEKGKVVSEETKKKRRGANNPNWQGGISFEPYSVDFNKQLKEFVWERDNYTCQHCGETEKRICTHHIDYNKLNSDSNNLITLCESCHPKTNVNREYWTSFFQKLIREKHGVDHYMELNLDGIY